MTGSDLLESVKEDILIKELAHAKKVVEYHYKEVQGAKDWVQVREKELNDILSLSVKELSQKSIPRR